MSLPVLSGKELIKILSKVGFEVPRIYGDHAFLKHTDGRRTTVPLYNEISHCFPRLLGR